MDFAFTEDQLLITETAREMLVETCTPPGLRRMLNAGEGRDQIRWSAIRDMGLIGLMAPEAQGGLGMGLTHFVGIAEAAGYVALPEPLVELAGVAVPLLAETGQDAWLQRAIEGAYVSLGAPSNCFTIDADKAEALLLSDGDEIHLVASDAVRLVRQESFDPLRRLFSVEWTPDVRTRIGAGWGLTAQRGAVLAAAQLIGLGQRCIDMAVSYAKERTQFGKPIGSYQAVKHLLATAQVKIEFARPVVHAAAAELPLDNCASAARVAHAKIVSGEAADLAARTAVQVYGAMGVTWEVDLHFFLKRAVALKASWGSTATHLGVIDARIRTLPTGPTATFASELA